MTWEACRSTLPMIRGHPSCLGERNLFDAALVAATFEGCGEILVHDGGRGVVVDEAAGHDEDVGIVVLTDEVGNLGRPAESGADALVLVDRHGDAFAAATDGDAAFHLAAFNGIGKGVTIVGIVAALLREGAEVVPADALRIKPGLYELLERKARMVGS